MTLPIRATIRLQFRPEFTLDDACARVDYLAALGISHVYASPLTRAVPGSAHGYDVVDYNVINPELGGEEALCRFAQKLRTHGMGLVLDIVPNHMATHADNAWWWSVLKWGQASPYARFFDIDWQSPYPGMRGKVIAPFLADPYADELEAGNLRLEYVVDTAEFVVRYHDRPFPVTPASYGSILRNAPESAHLLALCRAFDALSTSTYGGHGDMACELLRQAARLPEVAAGIAAALAHYDPLQPLGRLRLHRLLERQPYRLTWWRCAADAMNWRRFFEVSDLIGTRMERTEVFTAAHALVLRLYAEGLIDGVRIDHVDGLGDPRAYCLALRDALAAAGTARPDALAQRPPYILVEKILAADESLPAGWQVDGTSGYDFMNEVGALLHAPEGKQPLEQLWQEIAGDTAEFAQYEYEARVTLITRHFAGETETLTRRLHQLGQAHAATRDFAVPAIRRVLSELLASFPVYRTYADAHGRHDDDARFFGMARQQAANRLPRVDLPLLECLDAWLGGHPPEKAGASAQRELQLTAIRQFQQLTSALAAKSVEDTAFYRHARLLSRNEVGGTPAQFSLHPEEFHARMQRRRESFPTGLLATATHDHKRGEDARARLAVLSEVPDVWRDFVRTWMSLPESSAVPVAEHHTTRLPHPVDQYVVLQTLVGVWPLNLAADDRDGLADFTNRVVQWHRKALREAKQRSSWFDPDTEYETLCEQFIRSRLLAAECAQHREMLVQFIDWIAPAGALNSLAQTLLRLTVPGVPDMFQGCEWWDFSLTDPDNRRPVDFGARVRALTDASGFSGLLDDWRSGRIKQHLIQRALHLRRRFPELFTRGTYRALPAQGAAAEHVVAFLRQHAGRSVLVVVPRMPYILLQKLTKSRARLTLPVIPARYWGDTALRIPPEMFGTTLHSALSGQIPPLTLHDDHLPVGKVVNTFSIGLWHD